MIVRPQLQTRHLRGALSVTPALAVSAGNGKEADPPARTPSMVVKAPMGARW